MTSKIDFKIESWHKVGDILKAFGPCGDAIAAVAAKLDPEGLVQFLKDFLQACIKTYEEEYAVFFLEALVRSDDTQFRLQLPSYLEEFYWQLPMGSDQAHPGIAFLKTRLWICAKLISEWKVEPTESSVYAFRRLIAMGWPESPSRFIRVGEHSIEYVARNRRVCPEERRGILEIVRTHLATVGSYQERTTGTDALFGPWLSLSNVPDDIRNVLAMARTKAGGPALAERDIRNAAILEGLSGVALEQIQNVVGPVRQMLTDCEVIRTQLVAKTQQGNPHWRPDLAPLGWKVAFLNINHIEITVGPINDPGQVMLDITDIIVWSLKHKVTPMWQLTIVVEELVSGGKDPVKVTQRWAMA